MSTLPERTRIAAADETKRNELAAQLAFVPGI